jgi:protein TonB
VVAGWAAFTVLKEIPKKENPFRISLQIQSAPSVQHQKIALPMEQHIVQAPIVTKTPEPDIRPQKQKSSETLSRPAEMESDPAIKPSLPLTPIAPVHTEPVALKAAPPEPLIAKAPPPPPPPTPNIQTLYEEENLGPIRALLAERLKYPKNALRLKQQGISIMAFTLSPSGDISAVTLVKSSDFELLDDAARTLIETTAQMFPKPSKSVRITIPIEYKIR